MDFLPGAAPIQILPISAFWQKPYKTLQNEEEPSAAPNQILPISVFDQWPYKTLQNERNPMVQQGHW